MLHAARDDPKLSTVKNRVRQTTRAKQIPDTHTHPTRSNDAVRSAGACDGRSAGARRCGHCTATVQRVLKVEGEHDVRQLSEPAIRVKRRFVESDAEPTVSGTRSGGNEGTHGREAR